LTAYDDLANRCLQPLGHVSVATGFCNDLLRGASIASASPKTALFFRIILIRVF
jgi:hypothetical protein